MSSWGSQSRRSVPLPVGWTSTIVPRIKARDKVCQWPDRVGICGGRIHTIDHKLCAALGGTDDDDNLWGLCYRHTQIKNGIDANLVKKARYNPKRPPEKHPGRI